MMDCFGVEISVEEITRWNALAAGPEGFTSWNSDGLTPYPPDVSGPLPADFIPIKIPVGEDELTGSSVLEVGCGIGGNAPVLLGIVGRYVGIDISTFALAVARYKFSRVPRAEFYHSAHDLDRISAMTGSFDGVFGIDFFYHQPWSRLKGIMAFAYRALRSGGWLKMDLLCREGLPASEDGVDMGAMWYGFDVALDQVEAWAGSLGFSSVERAYHTYPEAFSGQKDDRRVNVICRK
jgi:SAM-dependent methyltransferase